MQLDQTMTKDGGINCWSTEHTPFYFSTTYNNTSLNNKNSETNVKVLGIPGHQCVKLRTL